MEKGKKILLTNDDGFTAPGINHLYSSLASAYEVIVVAPESEQSGIGQAFTYHKPLIFRERSFEKISKGYSVAGSPSDCVKLALGQILGEKPDVVVSGINDGNNTGIAAYYSGTVAAAREGAFWRIPGIAFSLVENSPDFFYDYAKLAKDLIEKIIFNGKLNNNLNHIFFNVNFPSCHPDKCCGIKVTKQSLAFYNDTYKSINRADGVVEYWLQGEVTDLEHSNEYDARAIRNNYVTVTPLHIDATAIDNLKSLSFIEDI